MIIILLKIKIKHFVKKSSFLKNIKTINSPGNKDNSNSIIILLKPQK